MGPPLSGRDVGQAGKARPLHACLRKVNGGTAKKKLERLGEAEELELLQDFASET